MFKKPIQHIPLKTMEEVQNYSIRIGKFPARPRTVFTADFSTTIIFYTDENGMLWITPYRFDIDNLLHKSLNFLDDIYFLPSEVYSEQISSAQYKWLEKIADEENWACTYEQAYQMAKEKGIKPIVIGETITLKQIVSKPLEYHFGNTVEIYNPLVNQFLTGGTRHIHPFKF